MSLELLSGSQITHNLHRTHATPTEEQSLTSSLIPEEVGTCMYMAQKLPRKALTVHSRYSVLQEITVPGAPGVSYSCRLEELPSSVPQLVRACPLGLVLRNLYSASPTAEHFWSYICTRDVTWAACTWVNPHCIGCAQARAVDQRNSNASCAECLHESLAVLNQIQEIWFSIWEDYIIIIN